MSTEEFAAAFPFRLRQVENGLRELTAWKGHVDTDRATQKQTIESLDKRMVTLTQSVDSLRKVILGFALSVAGSAIVFALSVLIATGKIGGK